MSDSRPALADLFAAAREDAPPAAVRDEVWGRVAAVTAAPTAIAASKVVTLPTAGKLLTVGALLGVVSTIAVGVAVTSFDDRPIAGPARSTPAFVAHGVTTGARLAEPRSRARAESVPTAPSVSSAPAPVPMYAAQAIAAREEGSTLDEEVRIVNAMRAALVQGDAEQTLALARSAERLPTRALEPEELALQMRALRALGRTDEALAVELTLRRRFPSALSR